MRKNLRLRSAFTLVELLVAAALSLVIMGIIAVAFQKSIDAFRTLRSVSQMQEKLKSAHMVLKRDLEADHFAGGTLQGLNDGTALGQQRLDMAKWQPPPQGFFCIMQGHTPASASNPPNPLLPSPFNNAFINEGIDSDNQPSTRAVTHSMHFTSKLNYDANVTTMPHEEDFYYATAPNNLAARSPLDFARPIPPPPIPATFASRWAELAYFLVPIAETANGEQLYSLYRRQRVLIDINNPTPSQNASQIKTVWNAAIERQFPDISWGANAQQPFYPVFVGGKAAPGPRVNQTDDVSVRYLPGPGGTIPPVNSPLAGNRMPIIRHPMPANGAYGHIWRPQTIGEIPGVIADHIGDDILLTDVLSFEIKANWTVGSASMPFEQPNLTGSPFPNTNMDAPFDYLPTQNGANPRNPQQYNESANEYPVRTFDTWSKTDGGPPYTPARPRPKRPPIPANGVNWDFPNLPDRHGFNDPNFNGTFGGVREYRPPLRIRITSLQIRIRVWDSAAQTARQMTIVQDMMGPARY